MNRMLRSALIAVIPGTWFTMAPPPCAASPTITVFAQPSHPTSGRGRPRIFALGTAPGHSTRVLAVIHLDTSGAAGLTRPDAAFWADQFRGPAARLGADAVVGVHWAQFDGESHYEAVGLAVEFRDSTATADSCGCVVDVPPPRLELELPARGFSGLAEGLQTSLSFDLARRGYYAVPRSEASDPQSRLDQRQAMTSLGQPADRRFVLRVRAAGDPAADSARAARSRGQRVTAAEPALPNEAEVSGALVSLAGETVWADTLTRGADRAKAIPLDTINGNLTPLGKLAKVAHDLVGRLPPPARGSRRAPRAR